MISYRSLLYNTTVLYDIKHLSYVVANHYLMGSSPVKSSMQRETFMDKIFLNQFNFSIIMHAVRQQVFKAYKFSQLLQ